jgi:membrane protein YqaA with SNARE-associated domain
VLTGMAVALAVTFAINVAPALMPPTWSVLAYFLARYELPLLPLAVAGALASSAGRWVLALGSRRWGPRFLSQERCRRLERLGEWIAAKSRLAAPLAVLAYSFGPIPSNQVFIAAGIARVPLLPIVGAFFVGRVVSYAILAGAASKVVDKLEDVFVGHLTSPSALALEALAVLLLVAMVRVDWLRLLGAPAGHD